MQGLMAWRALLLAACILGAALALLPARAAGREAEVKEIIVTSAILQRGMPVRVYLPPGYSRRRAYPVLYLFHGQLENQAMWEDLGLFAEASALIEAGEIRPLIIVTPYIDNSFGVNTGSAWMTSDPRGFKVRYPEGRFEDYILREMMPTIERKFAIHARRETRWIGGISMGGFAALHAAFRHPERFGRVGAHSPALPPPHWNWLFPDFDTIRDRHPQLLAATRDLHGMAIYLDCGTEDDYGFHTQVQQLGETLKTRDATLQLALQPGRHNRAYWAAHLADYLRFYAGGANY